MYTLAPKDINSNLTAKTAHNNQFKDGNIAVVLMEDVPAALRDKMVKVGK